MSFPGWQLLGEDGVARLVLDHPPVNLLTRAVLRGLRGALAELAARRDLRVLILSAAGKHFSAGADVAEHLPPEHERLIPEFLDTLAALDAFPLPTVAAVAGRCLGGGFELVLAADVVIATRGASFGQPEILLGVVPPAAAAWLPQRCGRGLAAELVFTGDPIDADAAQRAGLVRQVVADGELDTAALAFAARIARHSGAALRVAKRSLRAGRAANADAALAETGRLYVESLMSTEDANEGLRAFVERRNPAWRHR